MAKQSAGLLVYRIIEGKPEVLLVHPGGPFFIKKDIAVWSVPKGEYEAGEVPLDVAKREFKEETGNEVNSKTFIPLAPVKSKGGKTVSVWITETDFEQCYISSNTFELEWPPKSGKLQQFLEVDKAEWFSLDEAKIKILPYQLPLINQLENIFSKRI
jgi:predicted NUDIX family NTP pyrophosphohydrolase